jgi:hypothetical protein
MKIEVERTAQQSWTCTDSNDDNDDNVIHNEYHDDTNYNDDDNDPHVFM